MLTDAYFDLKHFLALSWGIAIFHLREGGGRKCCEDQIEIIPSNVGIIRKFYDVRGDQQNIEQNTIKGITNF